MDATIANAGTESVFVQGPNLNIAPGDSKVWSDVSVAYLDGNTVLKAGVLAGTLTVSMAPDASDAAQATQGAMSINALPIYAYADLPTGFNGAIAYCSNGRKTGEGAGAGTGVPAYWSSSDSDWHVFYDDTVLAI